MDEIIVFASQNPYKSYTSPCYKVKPIPCKEGDVQYGHKECNLTSTTQPICSKMHPSVCPMIDGVEAKEKMWTKGSTQTALNLLCTYDINQIKTYKGIKLFKKKFVNNNEINTQAYDKLMNNFCTRTGIDNGVNNCPIDPITGKQMTNCSRFVSKDKEGKYCRKYIQEIEKSNDPLRKKKLKNSQIHWCSDKGDNNDCQCLNASKSKIFNQIKPIIPKEYQDSPNLWYKPCIGSSNIQIIDDKKYSYTTQSMSVSIPNNKIELLNSSLLPYINVTLPNTTSNIQTNSKNQTSSYNYIAIIFIIFIIFIICIYFYIKYYI